MHERRQRQEHRVDLHIHGAGAGQLEPLMAKLEEILAKETAMAGELANLTTEVEETKTIIGSAIVLIQGLKVALDEAIASGNPAALTALSAELDAKQQELAAAITANTPTPPTP